MVHRGNATKYSSNFLASYKKGMSKEKTINNFLSKFGYVKTKDEVWEEEL